MIFVILAVLFTPLLPLYLKSKCPSCKSRKLEKLETEPVEGEDGKKTFITSYRCHACSKFFKQEKSGKLEAVASLDEPQA